MDQEYIFNEEEEEEGYVNKLEQVGKLQDNWNQRDLEDRLLKIEDDIKAAIKQHESLIKRHKVLEEEKNDLIFLCNEDNAKLDAFESQTGTKLSRLDVPEPEENSEPVEGTFFSIYTRLEDELINSEGMLQAANSVRSELKHKLSKLQQKNYALTSNHTLEKNRFLAENEEIENLVNESKRLSDELVERKNALLEAAETYESIRSEIRAVTKIINAIDGKNIADLKEEIQNLKIEYEKLEKKERKKKAKLEKLQRSSNQLRDSQQHDIESVSSVRSWIAERSALIARIKNTKTQLINEQQRKLSNEHAIEEYQKKFQELLGDSDSRCQRARMLAIAELESRADHPDPIAEANAAAEEDYKRSLHEQIAVLKKSLSEFRAYKEETLNELETELEQASEDGYTKLLARELAEVQANLNRM